MKNLRYCDLCKQLVAQGGIVCQQCGDYMTALDDDLPVAILNTSIATADGSYVLQTVGLDFATFLAQTNKDQIISAIGHDSTAQILTELLGIDVPVNRIQFEQQPGQVALVFKLNGRPQEGKILSREEIEEIGYKFQILRRER